MANTPEAAPGPAGERWRARRATSWSLRAAIFLAPMAAAVGTSLWISTQLPRWESATGVVAWWAALIAASTAVAWAVDRLARRLLPLSLMLRMTMLFPDRAPSRFRVALRSSNVSELRKRVAAADSEGVTDLSAAAELILSLANALNHHDRRTRGHGERTRAYADMLATEMRIPIEGRDKLRWAALLHDIGKLEVPSEIINKSGPLDPEEQEVMRRHPLMGMRVAAPIVPWLGEWAGAIEHHHEWWDGTGYPRGLAGHDISLAARIVSVADAFDVMTSGRSYQAAKSPVAARREITRMAGTQFDPAVARALMNVSLGRLRWALGPVAWLGQVPFFLDRLGRDFVTVMSAASVTAAAVVGGVIPNPLPVLPAVPVEHVVPDDTLAPPSSTPVGPQSGIVAAGDTDQTTTTTTSEDLEPAADDPTTTTAGPTTTGPTTTTPTTTTTRPLGPAPVANPDVASTLEGNAVTIRVLDNDTPAGLTLTAVTPAPSSGKAEIAGDTIRYTPQDGFHGTDTFGYRACDTHARCTESTVAVRVTRLNRPPVARDDDATTDRNVSVVIDVLANDSDPDGDPLKIASVGSPDHGSVNHDGSKVTYRPAADFTGVARFTYRACDPDDACDTARVTVTVRAVPRPPNAVDDSAHYNPGGQVKVNVLANDKHPDGTALDKGSVKVVEGPGNGQIRSISDGVVHYSASPGFSGTDTFVYRVCDVLGLCDTATVTLTLKP